VARESLRHTDVVTNLAWWLKDNPPPNESLTEETLVYFASLLKYLETRSSVAAGPRLLTRNHDAMSQHVTRSFPLYFDGVQSAAHFPIVKWPHIYILQTYDLDIYKKKNGILLITKKINKY
jgi:hypothetical protein